jgi:3-deoxy-manno-octulosonate cytidylyltransferase (CMP-KDO synthetase)
MPLPADAPSRGAAAAVGVLGLIPARWASTRFPGKPLAPLLGRPMVQWVWEAARRATRLEALAVASDDERILAAVRAFGGQAEATRSDHPSGSDRLAEVAARRPAAIVVNIQGDEPLIQPELIDAVVGRLLEDPTLACATAVTSFRDRGELHNPDCVKAVLDAGGRALYFSRAVLPFSREDEAPLALYRKHIGIYAYRADLLARFGGLRSTLEGVEQLEQLRLLENGIAVGCVITDYQPLGVDRPEDLARAEALLMATQADQERA